MPLTSNLRFPTMAVSRCRFEVPASVKLDTWNLKHETPDPMAPCTNWFTRTVAIRTGR